MSLKSIIFCFCFIHLGISSQANDDGDELIQIPKHLFTELMAKRDELLRLKTGNPSSDETTILPPVAEKIKSFLEKIRNWKDNIIAKAQIDEHILELKKALSEGKKSAKEFFIAGKEGGKQVFRIGGKVLKIALRIQNVDLPTTNVKGV